MKVITFDKIEVVSGMCYGCVFYDHKRGDCAAEKNAKVDCIPATGNHGFIYVIKGSKEV